MVNFLLQEHLTAKSGFVLSQCESLATLTLLCLDMGHRYVV